MIKLDETNPQELRPMSRHDIGRLVMAPEPVDLTMGFCALALIRVMRSEN